MSVAVLFDAKREREYLCNARNGTAPSFVSRQVVNRAVCLPQYSSLTKDSLTNYKLVCISESGNDEISCFDMCK